MLSDLLTFISSQRVPDLGFKIPPQQCCYSDKLSYSLLGVTPRRHAESLGSASVTKPSWYARIQCAPASSIYELLAAGLGHRRGCSVLKNEEKLEMQFSDARNSPCMPFNSKMPNHDRWKSLSVQMKTELLCLDENWRRIPMAERFSVETKPGNLQLWILERNLDQGNL